MSRKRRAAARVRPVARATSDSVSSGRAASKARMTASPRSSDWTKCVPRAGTSGGLDTRASICEPHVELLTV